MRVVLADRKTVIVFQLMCQCGALYELHSAAPEYPPQVCELCGAILEELPPVSFDRPLASSTEQQESELFLISAPYRWSGPLAQGVRTNPLATAIDPYVASASTDGTPTLLRSRSGYQAVLMNVVELKRLVSACALRVQADRQRRPDGWHLIVDQLAVKAHGWTFETAMQSLRAQVRERARSVLGDPMAPYAQRDLALRLWVADVEGNLNELLDDAVQLLEDDPGTPIEPTPLAEPMGIDPEKLDAAREIVRDDVMYHDRVLDKRILRNQRLLEVSLYEFGLVGEWPEVDELATMLRRRGADLDCPDEETFARFDALLDWIVRHGRHTTADTE